MKFRKPAIFALTAILLLSIVPSSNASKNNSKAKTNLLSSTWILPREMDRKISTFQIGKTVPIRFRLVLNNQILSSTSGIKLSLAEKPGCTRTETSGPSTDLLIANQATPSTEADDKKNMGTNSTLRIENGVFKFNWKISRSTKPSCYILTAEKDSLILQSPVFKLRTTQETN